MQQESFDKILKLDGREFIEELLKFEQHRFDRNFLKGSVYEEMNAEFGIFPSKKVYPVYFHGDIFSPKEKHIFVGMNPGYKEEKNELEQRNAERLGLLEASVTGFQYFKKQRQGLIPYFARL